jgi:Tol biopolymer transport system component
VFTVVDYSATIVIPVWCPNGSYVAYSRSASPSGNNPQVVVVDMNGGGRNVVVENAYLNRWTTDGTRLVIVAATGEQNTPIAITPVDGSQSPRPIASGSVLDASVDGSLFAIYSHVRKQETQIAILNQPIGASVVVSGDLTPTGDGVALSPDDRQLGFTAEEDVYNSEVTLTGGSDRNAYVLGIDGTGLLKLADGAYFRGWSADGQWAMIQSNPATGCEDPFG